MSTNFAKKIKKFSTFFVENHFLLNLKPCALKSIFTINDKNKQHLALSFFNMK